MCLPSFLERAPIGLKDTVLLVHRFDTAKLIKACKEEELNVLTEKGGLFDKLCTLYHLDDTLGCDIELVTFGLSAFVHFSELCWRCCPVRPLDAAPPPASLGSHGRGGGLASRPACAAAPAGPFEAARAAAAPR